MEPTSYFQTKAGVRIRTPAQLEAIECQLGTILTTTPQLVLPLLPQVLLAPPNNVVP